MLSFEDFKDLPDTCKYDVYTALFILLESDQKCIEELSNDLDYTLRCYVSLQKQYQEYCELVRKLF